MSTMEWGVRIRGRAFGFERSTIWLGHTKYMDRWILYVGCGTLRLHKFYCGDDEHASHTHPWWFITFPLTSYEEAVYSRVFVQKVRTVRAFRFHKRPADFEHIVYGRADGGRRPFYTLVLTGTRTNAWGFYPRPGKFIPWRGYK